jgi:hypothetical protein
LRGRAIGLGDSYGSGTGAGNYEPGTEGGCFRSANSYSSVIVEELRQRGKQVNFTNVTCSGSAIRTLREPFNGEPPQFDALKRNTNVVMLSIGTGDIDFAGFGGLCIQADCSGAPATTIRGLLPAMGEALAPGQEGIDAVLHLNQPGQAAVADLIQRKVPALAGPATL